MTTKRKVEMLKKRLQTVRSRAREGKMDVEPTLLESDINVATRLVIDELGDPPQFFDLIRIDPQAKFERKNLAYRERQHARKTPVVSGARQKTRVPEPITNGQYRVMSPDRMLVVASIASDIRKLLESSDEHRALRDQLREDANFRDYFIRVCLTED